MCVIRGSVGQQYIVIGNRDKASLRAILSDFQTAQRDNPSLDGLEMDLRGKEKAGVVPGFLCLAASGWFVLFNAVLLNSVIKRFCCVSDAHSVIKNDVDKAVKLFRVYRHVV